MSLCLKRLVRGPACEVLIILHRGLRVFTWSMAGLKVKLVSWIYGEHICRVHRCQRPKGTDRNWKLEADDHALPCSLCLHHVPGEVGEPSDFLFLLCWFLSCAFRLLPLLSQMPCLPSRGCFLPIASQRSLCWNMNWVAFISSRGLTLKIQDGDSLVLEQCGCSPECGAPVRALHLFQGQTGNNPERLCSRWWLVGQFW